MLLGILNPLSLRQILETYKIENAESYFFPSPIVGGWGKFLKNNFAAKKQAKRKQVFFYHVEKKGMQQPKQGVRGWFHK